MKDVTRILSRIEKGDPSAANRLLPLIYEELRRLASANMAKESPDHTLGATALVHEAYLRLVDVEKAKHWDSRSHFFAAAAEAMRRILVDSARRRAAKKRGGGADRKPLDGVEVELVAASSQLMAIHEVLDELAARDSQSADLVKLRYFVGLTMEEAAEALGVSVRKAHQIWAYARSWLHRELADS
jgi:RNA polymerase sigma factor (TIGR02999 family)